MGGERKGGVGRGMEGRERREGEGKGEEGREGETRLLS